MVEKGLIWVRFLTESGPPFGFCATKKNCFPQKRQANGIFKYSLRQKNRILDSVSHRVRQKSVDTTNHFKAVNS